MGIKGILAISAGLCTIGGVGAGYYYGFNTDTTKESTTNKLEQEGNQGTPKTQITERENSVRTLTEGSTSSPTTKETRGADTLSSSASGPEQVPAAPQAPSSNSGLTADRAQQPQLPAT